MSLDLFREACIKKFDEAQTQLLEAACAMTPGMTKTTDEYAMSQVDRLASARMLTFARNVLNDQYRKMTEPEADQAVVTPIKRQGAVY